MNDNLQKNRMTHLINQYGDKKVVNTKDVEKEMQQLNESANSQYFLDIEWYLNNGYSRAEEAFDRIEMVIICSTYIRLWTTLFTMSYNRMNKN